MKTKKIIRLVICSFIMLLALSTCAYAKKPSKKVLWNKYHEYYTNVIQKRYPKVKNRIRLVYEDINGDDIKEMLCFIPGQFYHGCVFCTYKKGHVVEVGTIADGIMEISCSSKRKRFCIVFRAAFAVTHAEYKLSHGKLKRIVYYHPGELAMGGDPGHKKMAIKNGTQSCSEKEYNKAIKKYEKWRTIFRG